MEKGELEENIDIPRINSTWKPCYDTGGASMVKHMDNFNAVLQYLQANMYISGSVISVKFV
jgi:hypothetical protein